MSIIVAVQKGEQIAMAADNGASDGCHVQPPDLVVNHQKVRRVGDSLIGMAGYAVYENVFEHLLGLGRIEFSLGNRNEVFVFFLRLLETLTRDYHFVSETNDDCTEEDRGSPFLKLNSRFIVANRSGIFVIDSDLTVVQYRNYWAIGNGCTFALGALHASYGGDASAQSIARTAAEAALRFGEDCRGDIETWDL